MRSYFEAMTKLETSTDESVKILTELTAKLIEENKKILSQVIHNWTIIIISDIY